jgi:hypothetical protein
MAATLGSYVRGACVWYLTQKIKQNVKKSRASSYGSESNRRYSPELLAKGIVNAKKGFLPHMIFCEDLDPLEIEAMHILYRLQP